MKTNNKCAAVRLEKSKLVAALAILAVAFVVIAAIPAVDVDATEPGTTETTKVAKVGDTQYGKIADAIAQADGKTVVLLTDVMESITIDTGKTVTLDLAGHKITNVETGKNTGTNANSTIVVKGTLTVIDSSESKSGEVVMTHEGNNGMAALYVTATGTATINGGYFHNTYALSYYVVKNLGTVTINDGKFYNESVGKDGSDPSSVIANGYFWNKESNGVENPVAKMTITGGEFKGKAYVKNDYFGEMTITGGTFDVGEIRGAAIANQSKLTIGDGNGKVPSFTFNNAMGAVVLNYFWQDSDTPETADKNPVLTVNGLTTNGDAGALVGITSDSCPFGTVKVKDKNVWSGAIIDEKNTTFNGTVEIGNDKVQFTNVKAGVSGIIVKAGSVEITGTLDASTVAARIAAAGGDVVLKDLTITGANGGSLTLTDEITVKGTLTVDAGARVIVDTGAELKIDGKVLVKEGSDTVSAATITGAGAVTIGQKGSIVVGGVVSTNGTFTNDGVISIINEKAQIPATISGNGSVDISAVASEGTISGDWNTVTTYTQNQTITLTGDTVLKEGSQIVIEGKLVIPEGITLTIEDGAQLVVFKSTGILENNGNIVVQSAAGAVYNSSTTWNQSNLVGKTAEKGGLVNIGAEIVNNGSIQLDFTFTDVSSSAYPENPQFYNSGKLTNKGEIVVGVESYFLINEEMTNAEGGIVTIDGQVSHTGGDDSKKIHNYGAIVFNGAVQTNNVLISMESADASVEVKAMKSGSGSQAGVIIQNGMEAPNGKS